MKASHIPARERRTEMVALRVTEEMKEQLKEKAKEADMSVSNYVVRTMQEKMA